MATEPETFAEWETRASLFDRYSPARLTIDEATLAILLSVRALVRWLLALSVLAIVLLVIVAVVTSELTVGRGAS